MGQCEDSCISATPPELVEVIYISTMIGAGLNTTSPALTMDIKSKLEDQSYELDM